MTKPKWALEISHFYCRPCAEYHEKTHPHYEAMLARKAERQQKEREAAERKACARKGMVTKSATRW